jgi:disulfide bond formation protein DsbB
MSATSARVETPPEQTGWLLIFSCWLLAFVATLGSLFFSEVMEIEPCVLCWYQRIFMYPLVLIFLVGMFPAERAVVRYAMPVAVTGWVFALYHFLVYSGFIPEQLQPCSQGVSCADVNLELFGFLDIPLLSLLSFSAILACLVAFSKRTSP